MSLGIPSGWGVLGVPRGSKVDSDARTSHRAGRREGEGVRVNPSPGTGDGGLATEDLHALRPTASKDIDVLVIC